MRLLIGSDESDIKFKGKHGTFIARIGVAVSITGSYYSQFITDYRTFFEKFKREFNIQSPRWVFSSSDLKYRLNQSDDPSEYLLLLRDFVDSVIVPNHVITNFVFASFGVKRVEMPGGGSKSTMAFIKNVLKSYFSYVPAWVVVSRLGSSKPVVYVDNFNPSPKTLAWTELLSSSHEIRVVPNGDKVNPLISTADLVLGYIKESILLSKWRLDVAFLKRNLPSLGFPPELLRVYHVGGRELSSIVPITSTNDVFPAEFYPEPIVYVLKENILSGKQEQDLIEKSPAFEYILRHAFSVGGSVKFISLQGGSGGDIDALSMDGGIVISLGPRGEKLANYLKMGLGFPVNHISLHELISRYGGAHE